MTNHRWNAGVESLETRELLAADLELLKNIRPGNASSLPAPSYSDSYTTAAAYNGWIYFSANDGVKGSELWRTDGTAANTQLFADLNPNAASSSPVDFYEANGKLYFSAVNPTGFGLFVTDGTLNGTVKLSQVYVGQPIGVIGDTVYFYRSGVQSNSGAFYKSNGTPAGTVFLATGFPETGLGQAVVFDNTLFFTRGSSSGNYQLWKIDTSTGAFTQISENPENIFDLKVVNGTLVFSANTEPNGVRNLWKLTSASSAPTLVQALNSPRIAERPENLTVVNGKLYFAGTSTNEGVELWQSDGTSAGTLLVKEIRPGTAWSTPQNLTAVGNTLFFTADDGVNGVELWRSDGLDSNTVLVKDIVTGNLFSSVQKLFNLNGLLTFVARTPESSTLVLWTSNGSEAATTPVSGDAFNLANTFIALGNNLFFAAENPTVGREPFILRLGVQPAAPVLTGPASSTSSLRPAVTWNAVAGSTQYEVWIRNRSTGAFQVVLDQVTGTTFTPSIDLGIGNFTVWVRTLGTNGGPASLWSAPRNFSIKAPVIQNVVAPSPVNGFPMVSWQALPGATKYDVWIDRLDVATSQIVRNMNVTATSLTPTTLPKGLYRVWVRGFAADGAEGAWSASQDFSSEQVPVITAVLNPTFDTTPTVSWTAVAGATSYQLYVLSINGNVKVLDQKNISGTSFTWPVLAAGPYRYWVRVTGSTIWSTPVDLNTSGRTSVLTPTGSTTSRQPVISWRPVDGAVRYELWVDQLGVHEKIIYQLNLTATSFMPTSNLPLGNYRVWVRAVSNSTMAPWSLSLDFTIATFDASPDAFLPNPSDEELLSGVLVSIFDTHESARTMPDHEPQSKMTELPADGGPATQPAQAEHAPAALPLVFEDKSIDAFIVQWMMNPMTT